MIREIFEVLNQYAVDSQLVSSPPHPVPCGMLSRAIGMPSCKDGPPSIWDTHGISGNVFFLQIQPRPLQHFIRRKRIHGVLKNQNQFTPHRRGRMETKHQLKIRDASPDRQPKIQSSLVRETRQIIKEQTTNDCIFLISTLTSSLRQQPLIAGR